MNKTLKFDAYTVVIEEPSKISFKNSFDTFLYTLIFNEIKATHTTYSPVFNSDEIKMGAYIDIHGKKHDFDSAFNNSGLRFKGNISDQTTNRERAIIQYKILDFFSRHPVMTGLVANCRLNKDVAVKNAEIILGGKINSSNAIIAKTLIDKMNRDNWTRSKDFSEKQSSASVVGGISELLVKKIMSNLEDGKNFFKVTSSDVQSYGDFVLMCLPNNLWVSVKSNYARERLNASGFSDDIVGIGFFADHKEFVGGMKVRNFQKGGFVAIYLPDQPITDDQISIGTSTYTLVKDYYNDNKKSMPININGRPFFRPLSDFSTDCAKLLSIKDITKRTAVRF